MSDVGSEKVVSLQRLVRVVQDVQQAGEVVVLCHGCFDIVHPGHIRHLQHAARQGDRLIVTITGDSELGKGDGRPLIPQELRAENLAALDCVAWVAINPESSAVELLRQLKPDVYVKGREYEENADPRFAEERRVVEQAGGRVVFSSGDVVFSSTALIAVLEEAANPFQRRLRRLIDAHDLRPGTVEPVIASFRGRRVLVIGETILDTYVMCDRPDVAGESPMITLRPLECRHYDGGAAIIARHLAAMGAQPTLLTALPKSSAAEALRQRLAVEHVDTHWIESDRPIVEKQRFLVGTNKVMKLDLGEPMTLDSTRQQQLVRAAVGAAKGCDAVIVADYGLGLFTSMVLRELCSALRPIVPCMVGDVSGRRSNLLSLRRMDLICPCESELRDALHNYEDGLTSVVWDVVDRTSAAAAIVTLGEDGLIAFQRRDNANEAPDNWRNRLIAEHVPAFAPYALDQLGCGDALLAGATLGLACSGSVVIGAVIGSLAAAAEAQRLGNAVIGAAELRRGLRRLCEAQLAFTVEPLGQVTAGVVRDAIESRLGAPDARDQLHIAHARPA